MLKVISADIKKKGDAFVCRLRYRVDREPPRQVTAPGRTGGEAFEAAKSMAEERTNGNG